MRSPCIFVELEKVDDDDYNCAFHKLSVHLIVRSLNPPFASLSVPLIIRFFIAHSLR